MKELVIVEEVGRHIRVVRGCRVMLDCDLAGLYDVSTGALNRAVRRNAIRFPPDFMLRLTLAEAVASRCQIEAIHQLMEPPVSPRDNSIEKIGLLCYIKRKL